MEKYLKDLIKQNPNFIKDLHKQFMNEYNSFIEKMNLFYQTKEFTDFKKNIIKNIKPFKFPMKHFFGENKPIQYQCFKKIIDEFEKSLPKN